MEWKTRIGQTVREIVASFPEFSELGETAIAGLINKTISSFSETLANKIQHPLLAVMQKTVALPSANAYGWIMEFTVSQDTAPYLVSSQGSKRVNSKDLLWVSKIKNGVLRVAVRKAEGRTIPYMFTEVLKSVVDMGHRNRWGNIFLSETELDFAIEHLAFYGLVDIEILCGGKAGSALGSEYKGAPVVACPWLAEDILVIVPTDRELLGLFMELNGEYYAVSVHNAARGMAVLGDTLDTWISTTG